VKRDPEQEKTRRGIEPFDGRFAKQIARTQKMRLSSGRDLKHWFRPPSPEEQEKLGLVDYAQKEAQEAADEALVPALPLPETVGEMLAQATEFPDPEDETAASQPESKPDSPPSEPDAPATTYRCLVVRETEDAFTENLVHRQLDRMKGEVLIRVDYSSLNYKDALCATGFPGVASEYPLVPGIDAAGTVVECSATTLAPGDRVIVTGHGLGASADGGFSEYIRVPLNWVVPCPKELTTRQSMIYGTAGFTAGLCVQELSKAGVRPNHGKILVTGATGGVGSMAVGILSGVGYTVTAATGKKAQTDYLLDLGAAEVIGRKELVDESDDPMLRSKWAGVVDTVGGDVLGTAMRQVQYGGAITCCGMVAGSDLMISVYPFILRGIRLLGIDSVECSRAQRTRIWSRLANEWRVEKLDSMARECGLEEVPAEIDKILRGKQVGRVVVKPDR
jgi:acrylyl-CoA reductase (NADPH)